MIGYQAGSGYPNPIYLLSENNSTTWGDNSNITVGDYLTRILSLYGMFPKEDENGISQTAEINDNMSDLDNGPRSFLKDITIHLAAINKSGDLTYIEKNLIRNKKNGYWMWYMSNPGWAGSKPTPNQYRSSVGNDENYEIYSEKMSSEIILVIELEGI
jgi:hypothetical protein